MKTFRINSPWWGKKWQVIGWFPSETDGSAGHWCFLCCWPVVGELWTQDTTKHICLYVPSQQYARNVTFTFFFRSRYIDKHHDEYSLYRRIMCLYWLGGRTSYHKISWNLEARRFGLRLIQSFLNYNIQSCGFETSRDLAVRRLSDMLWKSALVVSRNCPFFIVAKYTVGYRHNIVHLSKIITFDTPYLAGEAG